MRMSALSRNGEEMHELMVKFLTGNDIFFFILPLSVLESPGRGSLNFSHGISSVVVVAEGSG